jgi:hypothetical protein
MKYSSSARGRLARFIGIMFAASLLAGLMSSIAARAQATEPTPAPSAAPQPSAEEAAKRKAWRATIARTPAPKKGCFTASYPNTGWQEAPCGRPSPYPNPARGPRPDTVGNSNDYSTQVSGTIFSAAGSFDSVTPATIEESGPVWTQKNCPPTPPPSCVPGGDKPCIHPDGGGDGGNWCTEQKDNAFSLQLNSQPFITGACQGVAGCQGWEQFVFSQDQCDGPCVFIEYWLLNYGPTSPKAPPSSCATPWLQGGGNDWFCNSPSMPAPAISAAQLQETTLTAKAGGPTGDLDTVVLTTAGGVATAAAADSMLNLLVRWNTVEWNVFGDCCDFQATFSAGSTLVVRMIFNQGEGLVGTTCLQEGFTGETNNLSLVGTPAQNSPVPAILFTQSNAAGGTPASCVLAFPAVPPTPPPPCDPPIPGCVGPIHE